MEGVLAITLIFGGVPFVVFLIMFFRYKTRSRFAQMVESLADKGQTLDQDLIRSVAFPARGKHADLRLSMILIATGLAFITLGAFIPEDEAQAALAGLGSFPILIGLALLAYWFLIGRKSDAG